jgi:hypothetical protein
LLTKRMKLKEGYVVARNRQVIARRSFHKTGGGFRIRGAEKSGVENLEA